MHCRPQANSPGVLHWHTPLLQDAVSGHFDAQAPQWSALVARLTQPKMGPQFTEPIWQTQLPATQLPPGPQVLPHWPQLPPSLDKSAHTPWLVQAT